MVNHVRTLLLNKTREQLDCSWAEYVPADFLPTTLPSHMQAAWTILFGRSPDRWLLNWRANQFMTVLHNSQFASYLLYHDKRLAYDVPVRSLTDELPISTVSGAEGRILRGTPADNPVYGRLSAAFSVTVNLDQVDVRNIGTGAVFSLPIVADGAYCRDLPLQGSGVRAAIRMPAVHGRQYLVETVAAPSRTLPQIVSDLEHMSAEYSAAIFARRNRLPYSTFYQLWHDSRAFGLKLAGFLLTWAFLHHEYRNG